MAAPRNENVKTMILDAAEQLLQSKPLSEISLARIAEHSGVSKGTLYYYYKNKGDLLFDITDRYLHRQWEELIAWTDNKSKDTSIHRLVSYVIARNVNASRLRVHLLEAAVSGGEPLRTKVLQRYTEFQALISQKIAERTDKVSADYLTWLILMASDGIIIQKALQNSALDIEAFIAQSAELMKGLEIG